MEINDKLLKEAYFMNPEMIRFLLVENLALKTLLHEKNLFAPEEYKVHQERASAILQNKVNQQVEIWKKTSLQTPVPHVDGESSS